MKLAAEQLPHFRFLEKSDIPSVMKLLTAYQSEIFDQTDVRVFHQELQDFLTQPLRHNLFAYVLERETHIIGVIILIREADSKWYFEISCLAIADEERGKKYGQLLWKTALTEIKKHGASHVFLKTSAARYNQATQRFYHQFGFQKLGTLPNYYVDIQHHQKIIENCELLYLAL